MVVELRGHNHVKGEGEGASAKARRRSFGDCAADSNVILFGSDLHDDLDVRVDEPLLVASYEELPSRTLIWLALGLMWKATKDSFKDLMIRLDELK